MIGGRIRPYRVGALIKLAGAGMCCEGAAIFFSCRHCYGFLDEALRKG